VEGGAPDLSQAAADAREFNLPADIVAALKNSEPARFAVWAENMAITDAFLSVASQWRAVPLADGRVLWQGLDYSGVRAGLKAAAIALDPRQWAGLQVMERAAAAALNGVRG
jgi:hypothetical protein